MLEVLRAAGEEWICSASSYALLLQTKFQGGHLTRCPPFLVMWCPEKAALSKSDEGTTFAALRWHELFSGHTPDSFHPSLFNISGLLKEVQLIGQRIPQHAAWQKHLLYVRDELASRTSELELGCLNLQQKQMISRICSKQTTDIDAIGLARVLLLDGIEDGIDTAISRRVAELNLQECRKKKEACDNILQHAATVAYRRGGVSLGDADLQRALEGGEAGVRQLFDFNELFQQGEFECVVGVQGVTGQQLNDLRKVCDHGNSPSRIYKSSPRIQGLPQQNEIPDHLRAGWLSSKIVAGNAAKAVEQFKERVRNALNVISLFYQRPAASLHPGGWIIKNGNARPVSSRDESLKNHHPRQRAGW